MFVRSTFGFGAAQTIFGVGGNGAISASQRGTNLTQALSNLPSLNLPAWWLIGSLILVYVLLVGPVNYVVLRAMNRRALAWITVPAIAIVAAGGAYGTGVITKGTSVQANELSIIHVESGWDRAYQEAYTGILAPTRGDYQVGVAGGRTMISPLYSYGNPFIDPNQGLLRIDTANDAITMPGMSAFTLRGFASESVALAPRVEATATVAGGKLVGTVRNASTTLFSDGVVLAGNSFQKLGALAPGASATFSLQPSFANPANGPPAYQAIYANSYSCCPPQPQSSSDAEREAEIKFSVLNMLPVNGFKGIVLSSAPTVLLWTKQSFQDITVNGNHPHSYVESAVVLTLPVGQISAGTLGAGESKLGCDVFGGRRGRSADAGRAARARRDAGWRQRDVRLRSAARHRLSPERSLHLGVESVRHQGSAQLRERHRRGEGAGLGLDEVTVGGRLLRGPGRDRHPRLRGQPGDGRSQAEGERRRGVLVGLAFPDGDRQMIAVENLTKVYGKRAALDHVSFEVPEKEIFGFVGPNGAGKTTTLRILAALMEPTEGRAFIDGADVTKEREKVHNRIGYMPDFFGVYDQLTSMPRATANRRAGARRSSMICSRWSV